MVGWLKGTNGSREEAVNGVQQVGTHVDGFAMIFYLLMLCAIHTSICKTCNTILRGLAIRYWSILESICDCTFVVYFKGIMGLIVLHWQLIKQ